MACSVTLNCLPTSTPDSTPTLPDSSRLFPTLLSWRVCSLCRPFQTQHYLTFPDPPHQNLPDPPNQNLPDPPHQTLPGPSIPSRDNYFFKSTLPCRQYLSDQTYHPDPSRLNLTLPSRPNRTFPTQPYLSDPTLQSRPNLIFPT